MDYIRRNLKRIATDAAGYLLLIAALLTGWLPGPGGIPLALAGLALLSINNEWAHRIRQYLLDNGGKLAKVLFPDNAYVQWFYDIIVVLLLVIVTLLAYQHAAAWQIALAGGLFFGAVTIALLNRDRLGRLQNHRKRKQ
jgi:hypothetical protein